MGTSELLKHIYDINLSYLLLAQRLINQEKASAMFRLGIDESMADALAGLTLINYTHPMILGGIGRMRVDVRRLACGTLELQKFHDMDLLSG